MSRLPAQPGAWRSRQVVGVAARLLSRGLGLKFAAFAAALFFCLLSFAGLFFASSQSPASGECSFSGGSGKGIPANYVPWLEKAAAKYKLGPKGFSIVAAIHYVESDFGTSPLPGVAPGTQNSAGAEGPGQFLVPSWEAYGVDADGDGVKDPYSIPDSIFATANLLHADGAPKDWRGAIFDYNHAEWYVEEVLEKAASFGVQLSETCVASPEGLGEVASQTLAGIETVAKWIESRHLHYCWGGGHAVKPGPSTGAYCWSADDRQVFGASEKGLDCSGAVRWLLVLSGYPDPGALVSNELGAHYPSGPGKAVTIWSNVDHVWLEISGRDWGTATSNFAHGPGYGSQSTVGFSASHPAGL
jgi:hypothetical protein